ncbi:hypothetical protein [Stutzerimonas marianensis]
MLAIMERAQRHSALSVPIQIARANALAKPVIVVARNDHCSCLPV